MEPGQTITITENWSGQIDTTIAETGKVIVNEGAGTSVNNSKITNNGTVEINGNFNAANNSSIVNNGNIDVNKIGNVLFSGADIENYGSMEINGAVFFSANDTLANNGTVQIAGTYIPGQSLVSFRPGLRLNNPDQFNSLLKGKLIICHITKAPEMVITSLNIPSNGQLVSLNTFDFITGAKAKDGKILVGEYGALYFSNT